MLFKEGGGTMSEMKDPYHMTGEELQKEADKQDEKHWNLIGDLVEAAVEIVVDLLDGAG